MLTKDQRQDINDLLNAAEKIGGAKLKRDVWLLLPYEIRLEFNYGVGKTTTIR